MLKCYLCLMVGFTFVANGLTVDFTNTSTDADSYLWDFGDGVTGTVTNPSHGYAADGTYVVTLLAFNGCGVSMFEQAISVVATADLELIKVDSPDPVVVGNDVTYVLTITNNGPDDATGVMLTDTLPVSATFVSASPGCVEAGGVVTCDLGTIASGEFITVEIVVTADAVGTLVNQATVQATEFDPDLANNTATAETTVVEPGLLQIFLPLIFKN